MRGKRLPALLVFSDPARLPDLDGPAQAGPAGLGLVLRSFGDPLAAGRAARLSVIARARGHVLLIGADERLAARSGADGVHLPERMAGRARAIRARHPRWRITIAAHSPAAARRAAAMGADAVVLSSIFPSDSPSAGRPIGAHRLAALARGLHAPLYALGGVNPRTARALARSGAAGMAVVGAAKR